jgi:hypothetical protein
VASNGTDDKRVLAISKRLMVLTVFLALAMLMVSARSPAYLVGGIFFSALAIAIPLYGVISNRDSFLKVRNRYTLLFVVLCVIAYFSTLGIANGDTTLLRTLGSALITATSISAVFAGTIYEKVREVALLYRKKMDARAIRMSIRLAIYPLLVSIIAVFSSIMLLVLSGSNFVLSVLLCNITITAILLTLLMSVELLREDLTRQLY